MKPHDLPSLSFRLDLSRLGAMLHTIRQAAGLTQAEVAEKLDTQQSAIARWEADTTGALSLENFARIAQACGYAPLWETPYEPPQTVVSSAALTATPAQPTTGPGRLPPCAA